MKTKGPLPPLKALVALECVVRHRSVTHAAEELCVTHGAVSKQLSTLADWLGQPLFLDNRRRMIPTPAALQLANAIETGLLHITDALDELDRTGHTDHKLQTLAPASFAIHWLIPKLPMLRAHGLRMKAHVRYTHTNEHWQDLPYDLAIRADNVLPDGHVERPLFRDRLGLLAAPDIADAIRTIEDLKTVTLLESETRPGELNRWMARAGLRRSTLGQIEVFEHNYIAIEAALAGQGAVVGPLNVLDNHIARGALLRLFPEIDVSGPRYTAVYIPRSANARQIGAFLSWLGAHEKKNENALCTAYQTTPMTTTPSLS